VTVRRFAFPAVADVADRTVRAAQAALVEGVVALPAKSLWLK
jgi:hypothetical protein